MAGSLVSLVSLGSLLADQHTSGVPEYSSNPGADYTIYINVAGFNYTGTWSGGELGAPGSTPALNDVASTGTFNAAEQEQIGQLYAKLAASYVGFNVNVTTIDPAIAAGQAATDLQRQTYYDATPNMMQMVVGSQTRSEYVSPTNPQGKWYSTGADGVSGLGVVAGVALSNGAHTNWMFSEDQAGATTGGVINGSYIGSIGAHENGHAFGLSHQGDFTGGVQTAEYSNGDTVVGPKSYVPTMGNADGRDHITWRIGDSNNGTAAHFQNDVATMLATNTAANAKGPGGVDLHIIDDGFGHSAATAQALMIAAGGTVNYNFAGGFIMPKSEIDPQAIGSDKYTQDWFKFAVAGTSTVTLTLNNSTDFLHAGTADGLGTFRGLLDIYSADGITLLFSGAESLDTTKAVFSGTLAGGDYLARVQSYGGHAGDALGADPSSYYDMGGYFLTGSGFSEIPESSTFLMGVMTLGFLVRRKRRG